MKEKVLREPEKLDDKTLKRRKGKDACWFRGFMIENEASSLMIVFYVLGMSIEIEV